MHVIIIPPVDMLPKGMLTYSYNTCQLVPSSMLTCMSPTTCMSTLLHMSTYSLTMLTCSIKYVNMCKQVCQHAFHSQHACQEFSTCQHTAPFPDAGERARIAPQRHGIISRQCQRDRTKPWRNPENPGRSISTQNLPWAPPPIL